MPENFLTGKHNANSLNILMHLQLLCAQVGNELAFMSSQRLSIQSCALSAAVGPEFPCQITTQFDSRWEEGSVGPRAESTLIFDFYTHHRLILHRLATIRSAADRRHTDREGVIGIGRLCSSTGGLKTFRYTGNEEIQLISSPVHNE